MVPQVPGTNEDSKMYVELKKLINNRPLTNFIYASYLQPGVAAQMDSLGYKTNKQGQHRARDIFAFFDVASMKSNLDTKAQSKALGFTDSANNLVDFDAEEAYKKAQIFNQSNKGTVAHVVSHGDKFNILVDERDSRTQARQAEVNQALDSWSKLSDELTARGIDINVLNKIKPTLVNPGNTLEFLKTLNTFKYVPNDGFSVKDIELMLAMNRANPVVQNVMSRGWGTREQVAQKVYDILHTSGNPAGTVSLVNNLLTQTKHFNGLKIADIYNNVKQEIANFKTGDESTNIQKTIDELDKKYGLESEVLVKKDDKVRNYSDAAAEAVMSLQRQIRVIEARSGKTQRSEELTNLRNKLLEELKHKQYQAGLLDFMGGALNYVRQVNTALSAVTNTGTNMEYAHTLADVTTQANNLRSAYYDVIKSISDTDLVNDFAVNDTERDQLKQLARELKQLFDEQGKKVGELQEEALRAIGKEFIGSYNSLYGKDLADIVSMSEADSTLADYLYSIGRCSNTVVSMLGAIVRDAQTQRDKTFAEIALRIRRATDLLYKDGKDSSFMYDEKGRIVSPYDWDAFSKAKRLYSVDLLRAGFKRGTLEYEAEMRTWEEQNTHEVEVDAVSHRTERMPNFYLTEDPTLNWTAAQREYYDRMMQIKGEIGTLLPPYAQYQYVAPQKRTSWDQVIKEAITGQRDFDSVYKWCKDSVKKWGKIKSGEAKYRASGLYAGEEEGIATLSDYDGSVLRQIPLFYAKKIEANDLSHDFSSALQALAGTALNYAAMDNIKNIAEMITDYAYSKSPVVRDENGRPKMDSVGNDGLRVAKRLRKKAQSNNTAAILDSFVLKHIYGVENRSEGWLARLGGDLVGYTSLKGLAVNVKGALTNKYVGVIQALIKASGGQYYGFKDLAKAWGVLLGEEGTSTGGMMIGGLVGGVPGAAIGLAAGTAVGVKGMYGKFMDILTNDMNSKDSLIAEFFDQSQESYSTLMGQRYHKTVFGRLFGSFNPMAMYQRGEYWIHMLNVYATMFHEKVVQYDPTTGERKTISLYDALEKGDKIDGNSELKLKDNIFRIDGKKIDGLSDDYFDAMRRRIRYINQQCHGSMNKEDKGLVHQWMLGKMTMNFRQWMVEHYSRRFRGLHWDESIRDVNLSNFYNNTKVKLNGKKVNLIDALERISDGSDGAFHYGILQGATTISGQTLTNDVIDSMLNKYAEDAGWRRGFKTDAARILIDYTKELINYKTSANAYWDSLSETQRADVKQVIGEASMLLALAGLSFCMGDPNDHKGEFWYRLWLYVVKRCLLDEKATTLPGIAVEGKTIMNNPIASAQTVTGLLYPIIGLYNGDYNERIQRGEHQGQRKYWRKVEKYSIPFYSQIDQLSNLGEDASVFNVFNGQITR